MPENKFKKGDRVAIKGSFVFPDTYKVVTPPLDSKTPYFLLCGVCSQNSVNLDGLGCNSAKEEDLELYEEKV